MPRLGTSKRTEAKTEYSSSPNFTWSSHCSPPLGYRHLNIQKRIVRTSPNPLPRLNLRRILAPIRDNQPVPLRNRLLHPELVQLIEHEGEAGAGVGRLAHEPFVGIAVTIWSILRVFFSPAVKPGRYLLATRPPEPAGIFCRTA